MTLNQKAIALAFAIVSGLLSFICVIFIKLIPEQTMNFFGWMIHVNKLADLIGQREVTMVGSITGVIVFSAVAYVLGWLFAVLYNKFAQKKSQ